MSSAQGLSGLLCMCVSEPARQSDISYVKENLIRLGKVWAGKVMKLCTVLLPSGQHLSTGDAPTQRSAAELPSPLQIVTMSPFVVGHESLRSASSCFAAKGTPSSPRSLGDAWVGIFVCFHISSDSCSIPLRFGFVILRHFVFLLASP